MRHRKARRRITNSRDRLNLIRSLLEHEKIQTTEPRARELVRLAERMITLGKKGDLHAKRRAYKVLGDHTAVQKLFGTLAPRYVERPGGAVRMVKLGPRRGDAAPMAIVELLR